MAIRDVFQILSILVGLLFFVPSAQAERHIVDMAGRYVTVPDEVHKVYAIGHCIPIVAAVAPEKLANGSRVSDEAKRFLNPIIYESKVVTAAGMRISDEEIIDMAPDVIIMESLAGSIDQAKRLEDRLHVPVVLVDQDLLKAKAAFILLGDILGRPEQGRILADFVSRYIDPIGETAKTIPSAKKVRVYYAEGPNGLSTNAARTIHTQVLDFVGGLNVADVSTVPGEGTNAVSLEQLYVWQPDVVLVWTPNADKLMTWHAIVDDPRWQQVKAVKAGRVIQIPWLPFSWFDRPPGSNRLLGVLWLATTLYPDVFHIDLVPVTREYFHKFYHFELSADQAEYLLHPAQQRAKLSQ